jgi:hypothetical protein
MKLPTHIARIDGGPWRTTTRACRDGGFVLTPWGLVGVVIEGTAVDRVAPCAFTLYAVREGRELHRYVSRLGKRFSWRAVVREAGRFAEHVAGQRKA